MDAGDRLNLTIISDLLSNIDRIIVKIDISEKYHVVGFGGYLIIVKTFDVNSLVYRFNANLKQGYSLLL